MTTQQAIERSLESCREDHRYAKEGWRVQILDAEIKRLDRELERVGKSQPQAAVTRREG